MIILNIQGMTCPHCVAHVREALESVPGVKAVKVDLRTGRAEIEGEAARELLLKAVSDEGYVATLAV